MWELLQEWAAHEQNPTVLADAIQALSRLPAKFSNQTVPLVASIYDANT